MCTVLPFFFGMDPYTYVLRLCTYLSWIIVLVRIMMCDTICQSHVERILVTASFIPFDWRFIPSDWRFSSLPSVQDPSVQHNIAQDNTSNCAVRINSSSGLEVITTQIAITVMVEEEENICKIIESINIYKIVELWTSSEDSKTICSQC